MIEYADTPPQYSVSYSGHVRAELLALAARAKAAGHGPQIFAAVKEIDRRLRIYPQFGEPLYDLKREPIQIRIGVFSPLVVRYAIDPDKRLVLIGTPFLLLPGSGF